MEIKIRDRISVLAYVSSKKQSKLQLNVTRFYMQIFSSRSNIFYGGREGNSCKH